MTHSPRATFRAIRKVILKGLIGNKDFQVDCKWPIATLGGCQLENVSPKEYFEQCSKDPPSIAPRKGEGHVLPQAALRVLRTKGAPHLFPGRLVLAANLLPIIHPSFPVSGESQFFLKKFAEVES